jgi:hypothetical protein
MLTYRHQLPRAPFTPPIPHLLESPCIPIYRALEHPLLHYGGRNAHWYVAPPACCPLQQTACSPSSQANSPQCSTEEPVSSRSDMQHRYVAYTHSTIEHRSNPTSSPELPRAPVPLDSGATHLADGGAVRRHRGEGYHVR